MKGTEAALFCRLTCNAANCRCCLLQTSRLECSCSRSEV